MSRQQWNPSAPGVNCEVQKCMAVFENAQHLQVTPHAWSNCVVSLFLAHASRQQTGMVLSSSSTEVQRGRLRYQKQQNVQDTKPALHVYVLCMVSFACTPLYIAASHMPTPVPVLLPNGHGSGRDSPLHTLALPSTYPAGSPTGVDTHSLTHCCWCCRRSRNNACI